MRLRQKSVTAKVVSTELNHRFGMVEHLCLNHRSLLVLSLSMQARRRVTPTTKIRLCDSGFDGAQPPGQFDRTIAP